MKISLLVPCYNEEKTLYSSISSWLNQTRRPNQIIVIDDSSTDATSQILSQFSSRIETHRTLVNLGNKSYAQEYGMQFITGDIFISTDGDTILAPDFVEKVEKSFEDPTVAAVAGYVKSLPYNWLTACRALDYSIAQNLDKSAQYALGFMFVIPGAAGAFKTDIFKRYIGFDHDTLTEDLDFTYKLNKFGLKIAYNRKAISYTQDPVTLHSYINQMRRWYAGGWQNLAKHFGIPEWPGMGLTLSLSYSEGLIFSVLQLTLPFINLIYTLTFIVSYAFFLTILAIYASRREGRKDFFVALPGYIVLRYINAWIFIEQFIMEIILRKKNLKWYKPERVKI